MAIQKIPNTLIADNAVTAAKIANGTLTADDIAANSITGAKISATTSLNLGGLNVSGNVTGNTIASTGGSTNNRGMLLSHQNNTNQSYVGRSENGAADTGNRITFDYDNDRMQLDSDGDIILTPTSNVGIGTSSPTVDLDVSGPSSSMVLPGTSGTTPKGFLRLGYNDRTWGGTELLMGVINDGTVGYAGYLQAKVPTDYSVNRTFIINPLGGNVLVGTTSTTVGAGGAGVSGFRIDSDNGIVQAAAVSNPSAIFNRTTSNGSLISCRYNGVEVGNIQTEGGDALVIQSGTTSGSGLLFHPSNGQIYPVRNSVKIDNAIDLGRSVNRFKDIYLSGGVNFSANSNASGMSSELLDDYEEGTYTATISCASGSITLNTSFNALRYTKVGRKVHVQGTLAVSSVSSPSGATYLNLPFTSGSDTKRSGNADNVISGYFNGSAITNGIYNVYGNIPESSSTNRLFVMPGHQNSYATYNLGDNFSAGGTDYYVNFTYTT